MLRSTFNARSVAAALLLAAGVTVGCATAQTGSAGAGNQSRPVLAQANMPAHITGTFKGIKANTGHAIYSTVGGRQVLAVSDDFVIPDTPAPHWQVVDSQGNVYLLQQFKIKDGKYNRQITLPTYINDVAKVQVWCSYAEALLGEASFETPVK